MKLRRFIAGGLVIPFQKENMPTAMVPRYRRRAEKAARTEEVSLRTGRT
jgi:hypothetical protein